MINEGDRAPAMTVATSDGQTLNLASPGKPLVLYFYPKDDTSGCTREAQDFTALAADFKKAGASIVGVAGHFHLTPFFQHLAVGADQKRRAFHAHIFAAVHRLFDPGAERVADAAVLVGD
jgi:alkyl hydroperoxide reductase subunit AhpC